MAYSTSWEDTIVGIMAGSPVEWELQIESGGTWQTIFNGKSYAQPNENVILINTGRLMRDYFNPRLTVPETGATVDEGCFATFRVMANNIVWDERTVRYDYSFENSNWDGEDKVLSDTINGHADYRMKIMGSNWCESGGTIDIVSE